LVALKTWKIWKLQLKFLWLKFNEKIRDLLDRNKNNLEIQESHSAGIYIKDVTEIYVSSETEV